VPAGAQSTASPLASIATTQALELGFYARLQVRPSADGPAHPIST